MLVRPEAVQRLMAERILLETDLPLDKLISPILSFSQSAEALQNGAIKCSLSFFGKYE